MGRNEFEFKFAAPYSEESIMIHKSIFSLIKNQPLIFIFFSLLQIISILAAVYLYSSVRVDRITQMQYNEATSKFEINFNEGAAFKDVKSNIEKTAHQAEFPIFNITALIDEENKITANYNYDPTLVDLGERLKNNNDILIDSLYAKDNNISIGDKIILLNREFNVSGLSIPFSRNFIFNEILYSSLNNDDKIYKLDIKLKNLPKKNESENFFAYLTENFVGADITPPEERNYLNEYKFDSQLLISFSVMLLVVFNISFIYQYILMKRKNKFVIYNICGCTKTKSFLILFSEILCYFIAHLLTALAVWFAFLKKLLIDEPENLGFMDTAIPIFIYFGFMLIVFIPKIIKYSRQTTIKLLYSEKK